MNYKIEMMIDSIKDSIDYADLGYSGGQSVDRKYCPICGADDVIRYNTDQHISMNTLDHSNSWAYSLIRELEKKLEEEFNLDDLSKIKTEIQSDLELAKFPDAKEYNLGLERGTEIAIDRIDQTIELFEED